MSVIDKKVDIYMAPPYNMGAINAFQRALQDAQEAYGIEWSEINHRSLGKNKLPVALHFLALSDLAEFLGKKEELELC